MCWCGFLWINPVWVFTQLLDTIGLCLCQIWKTFSPCFSRDIFSLVLSLFQDVDDTHARQFLYPQRSHEALSFLFSHFQSIFSVVWIGSFLLFYLHVHWVFSLFPPFYCWGHSLIFFFLLHLLYFSVSRNLNEIIKFKKNTKIKPKLFFFFPATKANNSLLLPNTWTRE